MLLAFTGTENQPDGAAAARYAALRAGGRAMYFNLAWRAADGDGDAVTRDWAARVRDELAAGTRVVLDGLATEADAAAVRALGGVVVRVEPPAGAVTAPPVRADHTLSYRDFDDLARQVDALTSQLHKQSLE